jgi:hypothetical protein
MSSIHSTVVVFNVVKICCSSIGRSSPKSVTKSRSFRRQTAVDGFDFLDWCLSSMLISLIGLWLVIFSPQSLFDLFVVRLYKSKQNLNAHWLIKVLRLSNLHFMCAKSKQKSSDKSIKFQSGFLGFCRTQKGETENSLFCIRHKSVAKFMKRKLQSDFGFRAAGGRCGRA